MGSNSSETPANNEIPSTSGSLIASNVKQKHHRSSSRRKHQRFSPFLIKLADDNAPESQFESDSSAYNSFNEVETGLFMFIYSITILYLIIIITIKTKKRKHN